MHSTIQALEYRQNSNGAIAAFFDTSITAPIWSRWQQKSASKLLPFARSEFNMLSSGGMIKSDHPLARGPAAHLFELASLMQEQCVVRRLYRIIR
jgi:hypothetical protein